MDKGMKAVRLAICLMLAIGVSVGIFDVVGPDGPRPTFAQTDSTAPTVSSVVVTSDTGDDEVYLDDDGVYGIGDTIDVTVTFSENVTVTGFPRLELTIGSSARNAAYKSTTGSKVVFGYTVAVGDSDTDGISIAANKLSLNGGSIKDAAENDAVLSHSAVSTLSGHKVDGIKPTITRADFIGSSSGADDVHTIGEYLPAGVRFSEHVYVGGYPGPQMKLNFEGATKTADFLGAIPECGEAICVFGPGWRYGISVDFDYKIVKGDLDLDGVAIDANSVVLNGGSIRDGAGNDAVLTHGAVAEDSNYIVDGVPATVRSVAITSDPGSDKTYGVGDMIEVTVTFSESVRVPRWIGSGGVVRMPLLELNLGGVAKIARTHERSVITGTALVFSYTVQDGDNDADGISIGANKLTTQSNYGIADNYSGCCPGGENADLTHSAVADDSGHKVATSAPAKSADATLSALTLSSINFGIFASDTTSYSAQVANSVSQTTVTPAVNDSEGRYVIKLGGVSDADGVIPLAVGSNVITVEVTAEDDTTTKTYTVTVTRAAPLSTDATLGALTLSDVNFGTFASGTTSYTADVASSVTETTVTPTVNHSGASYVIKIGGVTDADGVIPLAAGDNVITIEVTAEDGTTTRTYTVTVTRLVSIQQNSTDATLSGLNLSGVNFGTFASGTESYTVSVAYSVTQTTVTPTVNDDGASYVIKLGGVADADGTVSLAVGSNGITVEVTAEDEQTTRTYTVTVTRAALSTDATLSALALSDIDFGTFASDTTSYTASVANGVSQTTVTPTVNDDGASFVIKLGGVTDSDGTMSLAVGSNVITVEVTAEDTTTTQTYTVTLTRAAPLSSDATLKSLSLGDDISIGTFRTVTTSYSVQVANSVSQATVTPAVNHSGASYVIKLDGAVDSDGTVSLAVGKNVITVEITAEDGQTTQTYTINVTRAEPPSTDARLSALTLSGIDFGTFATGTTSYTAGVANSVSQTTVSPTANDSGATYVIRLGGVIDSDGTVSLAVGANVITVEVTAEDDSTTSTYTVTVTRAEPPSTDATVSALSLSGVDFGTFDSTTISYTATAANSVTQTTVNPTVNDSGARHIIKIGGVTDSDGTVPLAVGSNVITVEVTAEDDSTTQTYTVNVTRAEPPSTDATLKGLTLSDVSFGTFSSATTSYTAQVANSVTQTTVTPTVNDSGASYVINLGGVTDADGTVSLSVGNSVITVVVTAEDGVTTQTYTVTVTREQSPTPVKSSDATLSALTMSDVNFGTFDSTTISYSARVANSVSQTTVTPAVNHSDASYVIGLGGVTDAEGVVPLAVGSNVITIDVTAEDGETTKTYTVTVTRSAPPSTDATLSALTLRGIDIGAFASGTTSYTTQVANSVSRTTVTPSVNHSGASYVIKLGGVTDADGIVALAVGSNVITVEVTAQDGSTNRTYTVSVTRSAPLSTDATLSALALSGVDFGTFDPSTTSYSAQVANSVSRMTVTPTVSNSGASYVIKLDGVTDTDGRVSLTVGSNVITVEVMAQDGSTTRTYSVTVTRASQDETPPRSDAPVTGELPTDDPKVNFRVSGYAHDWVGIAWAVPQNRSITRYVVQRYEHDGSGFVSSGSGEGSRFEGTTSGGGLHSLRNTHVRPDTLYQYVLSLKNDSGTTIIESSSTVRTLSSDATLSALTLSDTELGTFDSETTSYSADVANEVSQTTVTPSLNHTGASYVIKLGGVTDADGTVSLAVGSNVITVEVTAEDGETPLTYTVTITREELSLLTGELASDDPPLNFRITSYDDSHMGLAWEIPNNRGITGYALARYDHDGTEFASSDWSVSGSVAGGVSATESSANLTADSRYRYDLVLTSSAGTIIIEKSLEVRTLAAGAATLSSDATLGALSLSGVELDPDFSPSTFRYTGSVATDVTQTTVTATVNDSAASYAVKLGGAVDEDGVVDLMPGRNVITVQVTAEDGVTTGVYTVVVTRAKVAEALSTDATLRSLSLSGVDIGTFDSDITPYTAEVAHDITQTTVTPVRNDVEAAHLIKVGGVEDADGAIDLAVGNNVITVEVTAEDGVTTQTYTVTVTVTREGAAAPAPAPEPDPMRGHVRAIQRDRWRDRRHLGRYLSV